MEFVRTLTGMATIAVLSARGGTEANEVAGASDPPALPEAGQTPAEVTPEDADEQAEVEPSPRGNVVVEVGEEVPIAAEGDTATATMTIGVTSSTLRHRASPSCSPVWCTACDTAVPDRRPLHRRAGGGTAAALNRRTKQRKRTSSQGRAPHSEPHPECMTGPHRGGEGPSWDGCPAASYSPTPSPGQYHRR